MYDNFMILLGKGMVLLILTGKENIQFFFFQLTEFGDTKIEKKKREREKTKCGTDGTKIMSNTVPVS